MIDDMIGGEIYVKILMKVTDIAKLSTNVEHKIIGILPGEKLNK